MAWQQDDQAQRPRHRVAWSPYWETGMSGVSWGPVAGFVFMWFLILILIGLFISLAVMFPWIWIVYAIIIIVWILGTFYSD